MCVCSQKNQHGNCGKLSLYTQLCMIDGLFCFWWRKKMWLRQQMLKCFSLETPMQGSLGTQMGRWNLFGFFSFRCLLNIWPFCPVLVFSGVKNFTWKLRCCRKRKFQSYSTCQGPIVNQCRVDKKKRMPGWVFKKKECSIYFYNASYS